VSTAPALSFGGYCLAGPRGPLTRAGHEISLRRKTLAVLWCLAAHGGEIVEQERLVAEVWRARVVSQGVLAVSIRELRQVLGDDPKNPRYIRTVHRHGYQFLPPVRATEPPQPAHIGWSDPLVVGREKELAQLQDLYLRSHQGERQLVFVTGEAGIGKSTLVREWVKQSLGGGEVLVGFGQCIEHGGRGETYLCLLEALSRLSRGPDGAAVVATLRRHAPGWLAQLPADDTEAERDAFDPLPATGNPQHYQRELADALEALGAIRPLVLVLEDLHWCDGATVEALAVLARRQESARLLVIGTSRPLEIVAPRHPLRSLEHELIRHRHCAELALDGLDQAAVRAYLAMRLPIGSVDTLAKVVYRRTAGQPLFMANLTDHLAKVPGLDSAPDAELARAATALPSGLLQLIETQIEYLSTTERQVLKAGSVAGPVFAVAAIAPALELPDDQVEVICADLARHKQLIRAVGMVEWPDGTPSETFAFRHGLYQEVVYRRLGISRRIHLHRAIGERLERGHGRAAATLAVELAEHFDKGRDYCRAMHYHRVAGETALKRSVPVAAQTHIDRGLQLAERCPRDTQRIREELRLQLAGATALITLEGFGASAVARAYLRAQELCRQLPSSAHLLPVLCGLWNYFLTRAEFPQVRALAEEISGLIDGTDRIECLTPAHNVVGQTRLFGGEPARAFTQIDAGLCEYDRSKHRELASRYGEDPLVVCHMYAAIAHWLVGYPDKASQHISHGLAYARELAQPFGIAQICWAALLVTRDRRNPAATQAEAQALIDLCEREDLPFWLSGARVLQGWAIAVQGKTAAGIAAIEQGLREADATGAALIRPYFLGLLAEALGHAGKTRNALDAVTEALATAQRTGERWYEAELHRLKAELSARHGRGGKAEVEESLQRALAISREQQAGALELRAALGLARLRLAQGRPRDEVQRLVGPVHDRLMANGDTADIEDATRLIERLV
jgi:predicted ATPase